MKTVQFIENNSCRVQCKNDLSEKQFLEQSDTVILEQVFESCVDVIEQAITRST